MRRFLSALGVAVLTGVVALVLAGVVAALSAEWYAMSSFEGASGFFVVGVAFLGGVAGFVIGLVASLWLGRGGKRSFWKSLGVASLVVVVVAGVSAGVSRLLADVPPRLDGRELMVAVELRWPQGRDPHDVSAPEPWWIRLGSSVGHTYRASAKGPLWREDARLEDGRWVVPGAVELFTSRGDRVLDAMPEAVMGSNGFEMPLPGWPGRRYLEWSDWMPHARAGEPPLADGFRYRFKIVARDQPIRTERLGPFEVATVAQSFSEWTPDGGGAATWSAYGRFLVRHGGAAVVVAGEDANRGADAGSETSSTAAGPAGSFDAVALVGGASAPALLVRTEGEGGGRCSLLVSGADALRVEPIGACGALVAGLLTSDAAVFAHARDAARPPGRVDRESFAAPAEYLFDETVLDTRTLTTRPRPTEDRSRLIDRIPPLGVAPDDQSYVRLEWSEGSDQVPVLVVNTLGAQEPYRLPIDPLRMRYGNLDQIDPAWVLHHFEWRSAPGSRDLLVERPDFVPLPHHGTLTLDSAGYREYRVAPAQVGLRAALVDFLAAELHGEPQPAQESDFGRAVKIGDATVNVYWSESDQQVAVWMDRGADSSLVATVAERFDAALATGRYDSLFGPASVP